jgi:hypothetical protein
VRKWVQQSPLSIGVLVVVLGLVLVFFAWNGAANRDYVEGQLPYLISGGLSGLALVGLGLTVVLVQSHRRDAAELAEKLDELVDVVRGLAPATSTTPTAVPEGDLVVAGRNTYHRPSCRIAEGRSDLQAMSPAAAEERGFAACRICNPPRSSEAVS